MTDCFTVSIAHELSSDVLAAGGPVDKPKREGSTNERPKAVTLYVNSVSVGVVSLFRKVTIMALSGEEMRIGFVDWPNTNAKVELIYRKRSVESSFFIEKQPKDLLVIKCLVRSCLSQLKRVKDTSAGRTKMTISPCTDAGNVEYQFCSEPLHYSLQGANEA